MQVMLLSGLATYVTRIVVILVLEPRPNINKPGTAEVGAISKV